MEVKLDFSRYEHWHSYKAATQGLTKSNLAKDAKYNDLIRAVRYVLLNWHNRWSGQASWQSFLNKNKLLHEVEESIVALLHLKNWITDNYEVLRNDGTGLTVIDLCSGKGIFSMLLTYLASLADNNNDVKSDVHVFQVINRIIMIDRMKAWNCHHINAANKDVRSRSKSDACEESFQSQSEQESMKIQFEPLIARIHIDIWSDTNIHDESTLNRIYTETSDRIAIVGIHLCRSLSPRAIGITNVFGQDKVPFLCLAPCCLPRLTTDSICVSIFENKEDKVQREAILSRRRRLKWKRRRVCSICNTMDTHYPRNCPLLPLDLKEKETLLQQHVLCWNCGNLGHGRSTCNEERPASVPPPSVSVDLLAVKNASSPFDEYCQSLVQTIGDQSETSACRRDLSVVQLNGYSTHDNPNNLIGQRKCTWLTLQCRI